MYTAQLFARFFREDWLSHLSASLTVRIKPAWEPCPFGKVHNYLRLSAGRDHFMGMGSSEASGSAGVSGNSVSVTRSQVHRKLLASRGEVDQGCQGSAARIAAECFRSRIGQLEAMCLLELRGSLGRHNLQQGSPGEAELHSQVRNAAGRADAAQIGNRQFDFFRIRRGGRMQSSKIIPVW